MEALQALLQAGAAVNFSPADGVSPLMELFTQVMGGRWLGMGVLGRGRVRVGSWA